MEIKVKESKWNGRMCYLGFLKYSDLNKIINLKQDLSMNRQVNLSRVDKICNYIKENKEKVFFPPVILNCSEKINFRGEGSEKELIINNESLTIIDGQHRISSIIEVLKNEDKKFTKFIENNEIAFLLIESLEDYEHRDLFNLINESSTNVEATVSARFKIAYENLYGLRYINENISIKNDVEWELKQSSEKVCYIFITEVNKKLLEYIDKNIEDSNDEGNYNVIKCFWEKYFVFINQVNNEVKKFFVKKVVLRTLTETILDNIKEMEEYKMTENITSYEKLNNRINKVLDDLLIKQFNTEYNDGYRQSNDTYKNILGYLISQKEDK